jgi:ketosteroid isomerase-like protein
MSENVEIVRQPIAVRTHRRRRLEERLALRFPRVASFLVRSVQRLPPPSRLRQAIVRRGVQLGFEATIRGDYKAAFMLWHRDCEANFPTQFRTVGIEARTRGREERVRWQREWSAEWGQFWFEAKEITDLGDRVLVLGRFKGSGLGSGAGFDSEVAAVYTFSGGQVIREQLFFDRDEALEAARASE